MFLGTSCAGTYRMYRYRMLASSIMQWTVLSMSHWPFCSCSCSRAIIFKTRKKVPAKIIHEWPILCFCAIFSNCQKNTHRSSTNYDLWCRNRKQEEPHSSTFYSECVSIIPHVDWHFSKDYAPMSPETQMDHNNKRKSKKSSLFGKMKQATAHSKNYETFHIVYDSLCLLSRGR